MKAKKRLDQEELAERWSISPRTLERWRWLREGPAYLKIGGRVVYRLEDVEAYEKQQRTTAQPNEPKALLAHHKANYEPSPFRLMRFLEKIAGSGYGGMAEYHNAVADACELIRALIEIRDNAATYQRMQIQAVAFGALKESKD